MNILPELRDLIKEYTIGYRTIEVVYNYTEEVWEGDPRFKRGNFKKWYPNGNLYSDVNYVYGKSYGISKNWYMNGNLETEHNYNTGIDKMWYPNGNLRGECSYVGDKANGILKSWNEDGGISAEISFKMGIEHGISKYYTYYPDEDIIKVHIEEYDMGKLINRKEEIINSSKNRDLLEVNLTT